MQRIGFKVHAAKMLIELEARQKANSIRAREPCNGLHLISRQWSNWKKDLTLPGITF
jgi:hypothetical protein